MQLEQRSVHDRLLLLVDPLTVTLFRRLKQVVERAQLSQEVVESLIIWKELLLSWLDYSPSKPVAEPEVAIWCSQNNAFIQFVDNDAQTFFGELQLSDGLVQLSPIVQDHEVAAVLKD